MAKYILTKRQGNSALPIANVTDELDAINHLTDAVYAALVDGETVELTARCREGQGRNREFRIHVTVADDSTSPSRPSQMH